MSKKGLLGLLLASTLGISSCNFLGVDDSKKDNTNTETTNNENTIENETSENTNTKPEPSNQGSNQPSTPSETDTGKKTNPPKEPNTNYDELIDYPDDIKDSFSDYRVNIYFKANSSDTKSLLTTVYLKKNNPLPYEVITSIVSQLPKRLSSSEGYYYPLSNKLRVSTSGLSFSGQEYDFSSKSKFQPPVSEKDYDVELLYSDQKIITYNISFYTKSGAELFTLNVDHFKKPNESSSYKSKYVEPHYVSNGVRYAFTGWSTNKNAAAGTAIKNLPAVSSHMKYYAIHGTTTEQQTKIFAYRTHKNPYSPKSYTLAEAITDGVATVNNNQLTKYTDTPILNLTSSTVIPQQYVYLGNGGTTKLTSIAENAFSETKSVDVVNLGTMTSVDKNSFAYSKVFTVNGESVTEIKEGAFNSSSIKSFSLPAITKIGKEAFYNCKSLTSLDLSKYSSLSTIDSNAFGNCVNLKTLKLGSVTSFPVTSNANTYPAFLGCKNLETLTMTDNGKYKVIENSLFALGSGTQALNFLSKNGKIPSGTTSLAQYSVCIDTITSVSIPSSVVSISKNAFYKATGLKTINFTGTKEGFKGLCSSNKTAIFGEGMDPSTIDIKCSDGTIKANALLV